ncbi:transglutaminaseTgpA domain-containing protein [Legionella sp. W05-934-2]|uniref:transglutaminase family protein n=1 Tax=Legionella sp. W05-934-2 TaxID=1198649 RepID=UPI003462E83D
MERLSNNRNLLFLMIATVLVCISPILTIAPSWLIIACLFCLGYRAIQAFFKSEPTHWLLKLLLTILGLILLVHEVKGRLDYLFFIYFLILFVSFKVLEIQQKRDYLIQILVNFYVLFACLVVVMELWIFVYLLVAGLLNFIVLFKLFNPTIRISLFSQRNFPLLIMTLMITIVLFYAFPRISTPFWQLPSPGQKQTGFTDKLKLGDVHELVLDDSQAMKIVSHTNLGKQPYWRGLALSFYDGLSWQVSKAAKTADNPIPRLSFHENADIEIILEPTQTPWVITTGQVTQASPSLLHIPNVGIVQLTKRPITRQLGYRFNVNLKPSRLMNNSIWYLNQQYPSYANPRLQNWAKRLMRSSHQQTDLFIEQLKSEIQNKPFWYTLNPAPIGRSARQLDKFWFETREGYCEYYASAVAFILRVAGIPARVIVGYQGGQWNPVGQYLVVKQSDAHAWVEYWSNESGWLTLNPTAWIPANRIDDSIQKRLERLRQNNYDLEFDRFGHNLGFWQRTRYYLESANFFWQRWLLFYNYETQQQLLDILSNQRMLNWVYAHVKWVWTFISLVILLVSIRWWRQRPDPFQKEVTKLHSLCDKLGVQYQPPETFTTLCRQLSSLFPAQRNEIETLRQEYESLRYQTNQPINQSSLTAFIKSVSKKLKQWNKEYQSK